MVNEASYVKVSEFISSLTISDTAEHAPELAMQISSLIVIGVPEIGVTVTVDNCKDLQGLNS